MSHTLHIYVKERGYGTLIFLMTLIGSILVAALLLEWGNAKKPLLRAFINAIWGMIALAVVNLTGMMTGVTLPLSPVVIGVSAFASFPGVITLLLLQLIFGI